MMLIIAVILVLTGCSTIDSKEINQKIITENLSHQVEEIDMTDESQNINTSNLQSKDVNSDIIQDGEIEVHFIDVGQGDSVLIKQGNQSMLIDAGDNKYGKTVVNYLKNEKIETLDYVIGTHPHADHIGGLDDVILAFDVKTIIMPNKIHTTKTFEDVLKAIASKGLKIKGPIVGDVYQLGQAKFTILSPNKKEYDNLNNYSISIKLEYGEKSFIFSGDNEMTGEQEIVNNGLNIKADVLKAGHHGSNTSNTDAFVDKINPDYVVIQVGEGNKYGHPNADIVDKFKSKGIEVYRNDIHGTVIVKSDGQNISFDTTKGEVPKTSLPPKQISKDKGKPEENTFTQEPAEGSQLGEHMAATLIGTRTTKKLHRSDCRHVPKEDNRVYFDNFKQAINDGYEPCKVCKPVE